MMKKILGLDLGTNSIGWAVTQLDFDNKKGKIIDIGSRIIPMSQDILGKFDSGASISQTAERTAYRGTRRLYQRDNLRRERLHRVLNILGFLPEHYKNAIDFEKHYGQFKENQEPKLNYKPIVQESDKIKYEFIFMDSFNEMVKEFEQAGQNIKIPFDWTLYYLRKKALTKKITKEELAWIILSFNQKRGYYQLRGEEENEEETKSGKEKKFEILKVDRLEDSGEVIKKTGDKLYDVYFTNGWKYDKQITKTEDWIDKTKEFIVTSAILANGEIKRTYKKVDSEKDWIAIKEKAQNDINEYNKKNNTVGVANYIYTALLKNQKQKIRGKLIKTIERKYYKEELKKILETQIKLQADLFTKEKYSECIEELYPKNEAHKNNIKDKDFNYLFVDDIIFYQRPLKSKKSTISDCQYEYRTFRKINKETGKTETVKKPLKAIPKSHPLFQEFRLWQFLKNLKIYQKEAIIDGKTKINYDVTNTFLKTEDDRADLFNYLNKRKEVESKQIIQYFVNKKIISKQEKTNYRWNYVEDKKYPCNETKAQFLSRLKKVKGLEDPENFLNKITKTAKSEQKSELKREVQLWHIIYSVKDKNEFEKALGTFAKKNNIDAESFVEAFKKFPPFNNDYGAYSEKAIKKLLPLMRRAKYWDEAAIPQDVKNRIAQYMDRVNSITVAPEHKDFQKQIEEVSDDDIPRQLVKSFLPFKNKNPLTALNTYQACYAVYERHSEVSEITQWKSPDDIDKYLQNFKQHSLRNPIVEQVITETLRTVRDIWKAYGDFDEIHIELGREMKKPAEERKRMTIKNSENENTNYRIKKILEELMNEGIENVKSFSPSHQEILKIYEEGIISSLTNIPDDIEKIRKKSNPTKSDINKYKLWLEQGYVSPYTGKAISLSKLFTTDYQIEHIIPQSRYFDNSLNNKVICESEVNQIKDNQTAFEFIKNNEKRVIELSGGRNVELFNLKEYEAHCKKYFAKNKIKLNNLLSEDVPEGFINRQLNDSRYISKFIKSLLSNIVREENEKEATSKNIVTLSGSITSKLKQDWGLNDVWNEIIAPRFMRLNELKGTKEYGYWDYQKDENGQNTGKRFFRIQVPDEIAKGFNKKRIDHRHHALDALVIACTTRDHVNYITSINTERDNKGLVSKLRLIENKQIIDKNTGKPKNINVAKNFHKPWGSFTSDAKNSLEKTIISFKKNTRAINRTNNKTWQWVQQKNGKLKKELVKQKGKNFAVRKSLHKESVSAKIFIRDIKKISFNNTLIEQLKKTKLTEKYILADKKLNKKIKELSKEGLNNKQIFEYFKKQKYKFNGRDIKKVDVYYFTKATAIRSPLSEIKTQKHIEKITDKSIQKILKNHLKNYVDEKGNEQFDLAFSQTGIEELNKNIAELNGGKQHQPIYNVRLYEESNKFPVSKNKNSAKNKKYVEAAKGTNLFFAIYETEDKKGKKNRVFETIPFNELIKHQKQTAHLPMQEKIPIPIKPEKGNFLFYLSPNDLVYVPTDEEIENPGLVDFNNLSKEQIGRIYKMVSSTGNRCFFIKSEVANVIKNKDEFSALNKMEKSIDNIMIKNRCIKLEINRIGKIVKVED